MTTQEKRLAEIREAIDAENVSLSELSELQDIAATHPQLFADDAVLAEAAGIPEEKWKQGMQPAKPTPGPWSVDYSGPAHLSIEDKAGRVLAFFNLQTEDGDEDEANARLIAAAPDLFAALSRLIDAAVAVYDGRSDEFPELVAETEKACAALEKAEGVEP